MDPPNRLSWVSWPTLGRRKGSKVQSNLPKWGTLAGSCSLILDHPTNVGVIVHTNQRLRHWYWLLVMVVEVWVALSFFFFSSLFQHLLWS